MRRIRARAFELGLEDFHVSAESVLGAFTGEIHQMYLSPFDNWSFSPARHVRGIPLFRMAHDDVVIGRLTVEPPPDAQGMGWTAFRQAAHALQHGQVLSLGAYVRDGSRAWAWGLPGGEAYSAYLASIALVIRGSEFRPYHLGRMARAPRARFSPRGDLSRFPAGPHDEGVVSPHQVKTMVRLADLGLFPHGTYRHANEPDRYAWIVSNPWLEGSRCPFVRGGQGERGTIVGTYEATFDLSAYPGLAGRSVDTARRRFSAGVTAAAPVDSRVDPGPIGAGSLTVRGNLRPGETHVWFLEARDATSRSLDTASAKLIAEDG